MHFSSRSFCLFSHADLCGVSPRSSTLHHYILLRSAPDRYVDSSVGRIASEYDLLFYLRSFFLPPQYLLPMVTHIREILPHHVTTASKESLLCRFRERASQNFQGAKNPERNDFSRQRTHKWQHHCQMQRVTENLKQQYIMGMFSLNSNGGFDEHKDRTVELTRKIHFAKISSFAERNECRALVGQFRNYKYESLMECGRYQSSRDKLSPKKAWRERFVKFREPFVFLKQPKRDIRNLVPKPVATQSRRPLKNFEEKGRCLGQVPHFLNF